MPRVAGTRGARCALAAWRGYPGFRVQAWIGTPEALYAFAAATLLEILAYYVAGGGAAGLTQGATALLRLKSAVLSGGLANPLVATAELLGAAGVALLAVLLPALCLLLLAVLLATAFRKAGRPAFGRRPGP